jgi:hypothetical protein
LRHLRLHDGNARHCPEKAHRTSSLDRTDTNRFVEDTGFNRGARVIDDLLTLLERTPATVRTLMEDLPQALLHADEGEGTFSPFSVLGHLVQGELDDWVPRAEWILAQGPDVDLPPFDRFAHVARTSGASVDALLDEFEKLRTSGLDTVREIMAAGVDLDVKGTHPELGEVTLGQLIATWAVHDMNHISQIVRVVAHQFEDDVGPWRAYLPILHPRDAAL